MVGDTEAAVKWMRAQPGHNGKVGLFGSCSGGRHAFIYACQKKDVDACVDLWGGRVVMGKEELNANTPAAPIDMTGNLSCPLLGLFGNDDRAPSPEQVDQHEAALKKHGKNYEFHRYDGAGHGFFYWHRPLYRPEQAMDGWSKVFFSRLMLSAATISPNLGYAALLDQYFRSPRVHELLYGFPTFSGFEPRTAPASLAIIPWTIIREGVWYPVGGVHAIPLAIARACRERGVDIQTQTDVERIELDSTGQVRGVATSAGFIDAKIIVSNCDLVPTYQMLHGGRGFTPEVEALRAEDADPAVSFFTLQLGCNRTWPNLKHHLLVLTKGSEHVYQELFVRKEYPADPPIYVNTTSDTDPQDAIPGGCNPFIVISVPALDPAHPLPADFQERFAEKILNRLEEAGLPGLRESIQTMTITGPADWQKKFLSFRGSIYGLSPKHNVLQGSFRPINYRPDLPGLYLVGGSVQPGPGLPMVVQGGKITAARIARDFPAGR